MFLQLLTFLLMIAIATHAAPFIIGEWQQRAIAAVAMSD